MRANTDSLPDLSKGPVRPEDVLRDVYALRRKVILAVYSIITLDLPLYFVFGYTWMEVAILAVIGWAIAGGAIFFAFAQIIRLRKRSSYAVLMLNVADMASAEAGGRALEVVEAARPDAAFLLLDGEGSHAVITNHEYRPTSPSSASRYADVIETAMGIRPLEIYSRVGDIQVMLVPVVALKRPIGLLYMAGLRRNHDLADRPLLSSVGQAIGMSLDNLRQRELLSQKESRLRSVMKAAPVVVFAIDTAGVTTFMQGRGIERLGVTPEQVIGRTIDDVYSNYPQIVQGFRRAFAGEEVTSIATIETAAARVVFEYRLAPDRDEKGRVVGLIGVATDITERKLAEDALHESQRALETLVGNLPGFAYRCAQDIDWTMDTSAPAWKR
jgi:PAS domain S-box-containing protein